MAFLADAPLLTVIAKAILCLVAFAASGLLFWSSHVDRDPVLAAEREAKRPAYVSPHAAPLPAQPSAPRLGPGAEINRLAAVLDQARDRVQTIRDASAAASRQIDGAEFALNRLISEVAKVMPAVIAPTVIPRRELTITADLPYQDARAA
jgi:hypothetical protein